MTDAQLIYNALLRAEQRLESGAAREADSGKRAFRMFACDLVQIIREEVGSGLAKEGR